MIAACDTFRSGAVEQLKTHCNRLQIPLYEKGYEKDPAKVAYEAAQQAARSKIDVLLVDTAGQCSTYISFLAPSQHCILQQGFSTVGGHTGMLCLSFDQPNTEDRKDQQFKVLEMTSSICMPSVSLPRTWTQSQPQVT